MDIAVRTSCILYNCAYVHINEGKQIYIELHITYIYIYRIHAFAFEYTHADTFIK